MQLRELIGDRVFFLGPKVAQRDMALQALTDGLAVRGVIREFQRERVLLGLLKREATAPTSLGNGVAIPHAKLSCIHAFIGALGIARSGIDFGSPDGTPIQAIFLLLSPETHEKDHLALIGLLSRAVRTPDFVDRITDAESVEEVQRILREAEDFILGA